LNDNIKGAKVTEDFKEKKIHTSGIGADLFRSIGVVPIKEKQEDHWETRPFFPVDGVR
jgi:hypothetical protein